MRPQDDRRDINPDATMENTFLPSDLLARYDGSIHNYKGTYIKKSYVSDFFDQSSGRFDLNIDAKFWCITVQEHLILFATLLNRSYSLEVLPHRHQLQLQLDFDLF